MLYGSRCVTVWNDVGDANIESVYCLIPSATKNTVRSEKDCNNVGAVVCNTLTLMMWWMLKDEKEDVHCTFRVLNLNADAQQWNSTVSDQQRDYWKGRKGEWDNKDAFLNEWGGVRVRQWVRWRMKERREWQEVGHLISMIQYTLSVYWSSPYCFIPWLCCVDIVSTMWQSI